MQTITLTTEFIPLNQLLKALGWVENGGFANFCIANGEVKVNGKIELRKRNKITPGNTVEYNGNIATTA